MGRQLRSIPIIAQQVKIDDHDVRPPTQRVRIVPQRERVPILLAEEHRARWSTLQGMCRERVRRAIAAEIHRREPGGHGQQGHRNGSDAAHPGRPRPAASECHDRPVQSHTQPQRHTDQHGDQIQVRIAGMVADRKQGAEHHRDAAGSQERPVGRPQHCRAKPGDEQPHSEKLPGQQAAPRQQPRPQVCRRQREHKRLVQPPGDHPPEPCRRLRIGPVDRRVGGGPKPDVEVNRQPKQDAQRTPPPPAQPNQR